MSEFSVTTTVLSEETDVWSSVVREIRSKKESIDSIRSSLSMTGEAAASVKVSLKNVSKQLEEIQKRSTAMKKALTDIVSDYEKTEKRIKGTNGLNMDKGSEFANDSKPDDKEERDFIENYKYKYGESDIEVPVCIEFLDKNSCLEMADRIIAEHGNDGICNGMDRKRIAKELYAHTIGYFFFSELEYMGIDSDLLQELIEHGEVADIGLGDGLDLHYNLIWGFFDPLKLVD